MRNDAAVTVLPNISGGFTASQVITISNNDGGTNQAVVNLLNQSGSIASSASSGGYQVQITLQADAPTEQQARQALATMSIAHTDALDGSTLYLNNEVQFAEYQASNVNRTALVAAALPSALDYQLYQRLISGALGSSGLGGSDVQFDTTSGASTLSGTWDAAGISSISGAATASGDIASLHISTVSGVVQTTLSSARSSHSDIESTSGGIDATVTRTGNSGFDLEGQTNSGTAAVAVAGTQPVGTQTSNHAHYRSDNYATSSPQVSVNARSTSGSILIHE